MKKGVSLSLSTIVVAALVLIVLIILVAILMGQTRIFKGAIAGECPVEDENVACVAAGGCKDGIKLLGSCGTEGSVCCKTIPDKGETK
jgi:cytochrome c biogenesis protein ResB